MLRKAGEVLVIAYMATVICLTGLAGVALVIGWPALILMLLVKGCKMVVG